MLVKPISVWQDKPSKNTSFGWGHEVHKAISLELCKKFNKALRQGFIDVDIIRDASCNPDKFIPVKQHYANVHRFSSKEKTADAFTMVKKCYEDAMRCHREGNYKKRDKFLGFLLHFLQDLFSPVHATRFRETKSENPELAFHSAFEGRADMRVYDILKQMSAQNQRTQRPSGDFFAQLEKAMQKTQNTLQEMVRASNYPTDISIQELPDDAIDNIFRALNSTNKPKEMVKTLKRAVDDSLKNTYEMTELFFAHLVEELNKQSAQKVAGRKSK